MLSVTWIYESCRDRRRSILYPGLVYFVSVTQALIWDKRKCLISEFLLYQGLLYQGYTVHISNSISNSTVFVCTQ